jgi:hypothetical protein
VRKGISKVDLISNSKMCRNKRTEKEKGLG